ncbi:MAG: RNA polymerase sigma factor (sigma-70 family) [Hyphomicrobiaceae bacterium]|jgi:RNA polymerase sigma factor (sigma-70 family)
MRRSADQTLDELLVLSCCDGSKEAFAALHRRWHKKLLVHAGHLLGRSLRDRADDVCQEAWLAIARGIEVLSEPELFRAWAYSIVTRRVADLRRTLGRVERATEGLRQEIANPEVAADDSGDEQESLRLALETLSSEDRALLRLFYLDELSVAETAEALNIPVGTVKSRLFHARQRLRRALQRSTT